MKRLLLCLLAACLIAVAMAGAAHADLSTCINATCRVMTPGGGPAGTGSVVHVDATTVYVLTNAHVVASSPTMVCQFYLSGHESALMTGRVLARQRSEVPAIDIACIGVPLAIFAGRPPASVPLSTGPSPQIGQTIASVGSSGSSWPSAFVGRVVAYDEADGAMVFVPCPAPGRSGSAIYNADGTAVVGLLFGKEPRVLRDGSRGDRYGYAMPLGQLRKILCSAKQIDLTQSQCPGGACPLPNQQYWLPYRSEQEKRLKGIEQQVQQGPAVPSTGGGAWPSLGPTQAGGALDLSTVNQRLSNLESQQAEQLKLIDANTARFKPLEDTANKAKALADQWPELQAALRSLEQTTSMAAGQANEAKAGADKAIEAATTVAGKAAETKAEVDAALDEDAPNGLLGKLKARLDDRLESTVTGKVAAALAAKTGLPLGAIGGGLGLLAVVLILLIRKDIKDKIETGDPLLIEKIAARTRNQIDDRLAGFVSSRVDAHASPDHGWREEMADIKGMLTGLREKVAEKTGK